jgi:NAD(P)-dependent dehydrogenase (short-subunit alcohol dehydrogenase family)
VRLSPREQNQRGVQGKPSPPNSAIRAAQQLPPRRIATTDDISDAVVFAATNPNIAGTIIETDGGARLVSTS